MEGAEDCQVQGFLVDDDLAVVVTKKNTQKKKQVREFVHNSSHLYIWYSISNKKTSREKKKEEYEYEYEYYSF